MATFIWWIRRDLRLDDNPALQAALREGGLVIPVFVLDEFLLNNPAPNRQGFLFTAMRSLDASLRLLGSRLVVRKGSPAQELVKLAAETGAQAVYAEEDYSPYARRRDAEVSSRLDLHLVVGATVHHPNAVVKADGSPYTVFTPFSKVWKALPFSSYTEKKLVALPPVPELASLPIPDGEAPAGFPASEGEAQRRLQDFLNQRISAYHDARNRMDLDGTSALSPYFRFGLLSARRAAAAAREAAQRMVDPVVRQGAETWLNELIWREFYAAILYHFPNVLTQAFNPQMRNIPWRSAPQDLQAWKEGRTGYPVVDAAMRQLRESGWMHNRARMITASFLVKDLLINWQEGERHFMEYLVDGDPASNNGGWQWTAGVGTDAAPYFRVFNPLLQSAKFDPLGGYIRCWVPELASTPDQFIHQPWLMDTATQRRVGCEIGVHYPAPIVDHAMARERVLAAYKKI
ncbi:MAG: deoxyribodipyrimidine photo-lyase [Anaerolineaceae bacterium]|nr:deoxyribodipyrimidine photo-lyase [Anaerolineaceae bacterium]